MCLVFVTGAALLLLSEGSAAAPEGDERIIRHTSAEGRLQLPEPFGGYIVEPEVHALLTSWGFNSSRLALCGPDFTSLIVNTSDTRCWRRGEVQISGTNMEVTQVSMHDCRAWLHERGAQYSKKLKARGLRDLISKRLQAQLPEFGILSLFETALRNRANELGMLPPGSPSAAMEFTMQALAGS